MGKYTGNDYKKDCDCSDCVEWKKHHPYAENGDKMGYPAYENVTEFEDAQDEDEEDSDDDGGGPFYSPSEVNDMLAEIDKDIEHP